ncbi:MAG TPA: BrnT family toxin [Terriglobia bacterium]|jgi:hypothetical protein
MSLEFGWDPKKAKENLSKHVVSFEEGMTVFADPLAKIFKDEDHSHAEHREIIIGHSARERLLLVSFAAEGTRVRIISARKATATERRDYEENT